MPLLLAARSYYLCGAGAAQDVTVARSKTKAASVGAYSEVRSNEHMYANNDLYNSLL